MEGLDVSRAVHIAMEIWHRAAGVLDDEFARNVFAAVQVSECNRKHFERDHFKGLNPHIAPLDSPLTVRPLDRVGELVESFPYLIPDHGIRVEMRAIAAAAEAAGETGRIALDSLLKHALPSLKRRPKSSRLKVWQSFLSQYVERNSEELAGLKSADFIEAEKAAYISLNMKEWYKERSTKRRREGASKAREKARRKKI